jgi:hypothetical protein
MKTTCLLIFFFFVSFAGKAIADVTSDYTDRINSIVYNLRMVCMAPSEMGKYWNVTLTGDGSAKVGMLKSTDINVSGSAVFSRGEWEGVKQVLDQGIENKSYRHCIERLTPVFVKKFSTIEKENSSDSGIDIDEIIRNKKVIVLFSDQIELSRLASELKKELSGFGAKVILQPIPLPKSISDFDRWSVSYKPGSDGEFVTVNGYKQFIRFNYILYRKPEELDAALFIKDNISAKTFVGISLAPDIFERLPNSSIILNLPSYPANWPSPP